MWKNIISPNCVFQSLEAGLQHSWESFLSPGGMCDKITILIRRWHFQCELTSSDQFLIGELLNSIGASPNTIRLGSPVLRKESGSDVWPMGLSGLIATLLFPLKHPICLSRLKCALLQCGHLLDNHKHLVVWI